jgi:hypothetical protein
VPNGQRRRAALRSGTCRTLAKRAQARWAVAAAGGWGPRQTPNAHTNWFSGTAVLGGDVGCGSWFSGTSSRAGPACSLQDARMPSAARAFRRQTREQHAVPSAHCTCDWYLVPELRQCVWHQHANTNPGPSEPSIDVRICYNLYYRNTLYNM